MILDVQFDENVLELNTHFEEDQYVLTAEFEENTLELNAQFEEAHNTFDVNLGEIQVIRHTEIITDLPFYEGNYDVTPKVDAQTLKTAKTIMLEDVTIRSIPYFETSNMSGGNTVYIGTEI